MDVAIAYVRKDKTDAYFTLTYKNTKLKTKVKVSEHGSSIDFNQEFWVPA